jgi:iron uptake system EfeUOB component EfeO/EfeM
MKHRVVVAAVATAAVAVLAACSGEGTKGGGGVAITATDSACQIAQTAFEPGPVTFTVTNKGDKTTEVYIYGDNNGSFTKVISEVENIGPSLTRDLTATLAAGRYEIACKPGQTGDGIRTAITVTGAQASAVASAAAPAEAAYDHEIEIKVTAAGVRGADGLSATAGQKIEFKLENDADAKRELEIINPAGKIVAEVEAVPAGAAETVVALIDPGTWKLKIEGDGMTEVEKTLTVS